MRETSRFLTEKKEGFVAFLLNAVAELGSAETGECLETRLGEILAERLGVSPQLVSGVPWSGDADEIRAFGPR